MGAVVQFGRVLAQHAGDPGFELLHQVKPSVVAHVWNPGTWEMEAGESGVHSYPWLNRGVKASLG